MTYWHSCTEQVPSLHFGCLCFLLAYSKHRNYYMSIHYLVPGSALCCPFYYKKGLAKHITCLRVIFYIFVKIYDMSCLHYKFFILSKGSDPTIQICCLFRSLSFVTCMGCMSFVLLGLMYFVVDIKEWWGGQPFIYPVRRLHLFKGIVCPEIKYLLKMDLPSDHPNCAWVCFFRNVVFHHQWILCTEWVPSEWESLNENFNSW